MKKFLSFIFDVLEMVLLAAIIVVPIRFFIFQPFFIRGQSMEPNFADGDYLIIDEISYRFREPQRGEIIVFKFPQNPSQRYIKRIVGLPGETVEIKDGDVIITNEKGSEVLDESGYLSSSLETPGNTKISLKTNEYFVLGDNRSFSFDSRRWGVLPKENIIGRVLFRVLPITALAKIQAPSY